MANARLEVRENRDEVAFLYKVVPGAAQKSYGLYVAKLAGLPLDVVERAETLLAEIEAGQPLPGDQQQRVEQPQAPGDQAVVSRLARIDPLRTTPIEALLLIAELKQMAEERVAEAQASYTGTPDK